MIWVDRVGVILLFGSFVGHMGFGGCVFGVMFRLGFLSDMACVVCACYVIQVCSHICESSLYELDHHRYTVVVWISCVPALMYEFGPIVQCMRTYSVFAE